MAISNVFTAFEPDLEPGRSISTHPRERRPLPAKTLQRLRQDENICRSKLLDVLERSGATLAILSRRGSCLGRYEFDTEVPHYTHMAFAVKSGGTWSVDHLLNTHGGAEGHLYRQDLVDFFRDDPFEYHFGVMVPSPKLQAQIRDVLQSPTRQRLYSKSYSCVAYPFSIRFQSSNQWLAEIIAAAQCGLNGRTELQAFLQQQGLRPTIMKLNLIKQLAAPFVTRNTQTSDQPLSLRARGRIGFLMEPSIRSYIAHTDQCVLDCRVCLEESDPAEASETVELRPQFAA